MHGRKNAERRDSITDTILREREQHHFKIQDTPLNLMLEKYLEEVGLGSKRKRSLVYNKLPLHLQTESKKSLTGAGGFCVHLASASANWPLFKHMLPEIAFAGHSNSGKSTLVNAISGLPPRKGPAGVSDRAGWTDQICFYQLCKKPPIFTLVDMPGYGHAVASALDRKQWNNMNRDYVSVRKVLSRCCILVDCTRGLCDGDRSLAKFCTVNGVEWQIVLTKCDLLNTADLAKSITIVHGELKGLFPHLDVDVESSSDIEEKYSDAMHRQRRPDFKLIMPVCSQTGAGIGELWDELQSCARSSSEPPNGTGPGSEFAVREHIRAKEARIVRSR